MIEVAGIAHDFAKSNDIGVERLRVIGDLADLVHVSVAGEVNGDSGGGHGGEVEMDIVWALGYGTCAQGELAADGGEGIVTVQPVKGRLFGVGVSPARRGVRGGAVLVEQMPSIAIAQDSGGGVEDAVFRDKMQFGAVGCHGYPSLNQTAVNIDGLGGNRSPRKITNGTLAAGAPKFGSALFIGGDVIDCSGEIGLEGCGIGGVVMH